MDEGFVLMKSPPPEIQRLNSAPMSFGRACINHRQTVTRWKRSGADLTPD